MDQLRAFRSWFWSESVWLPPNTTWKDYDNTLGGTQYAQFNDLYLSCFTALVLLAVRYTLERFIYAPVGVYLGLNPGKRKGPVKNEILEKAYRENRRLSHKQIEALAKRLDWTERQIERWLRQRSSVNKPTTLKKFQESAWRCTFYFSAFCYGLYVLRDKPWMWDSVYCFIDYPRHSVSSGEWWYYNIEMGFYLSLVVSQFFDIQRKDFWQMFVHHIVTLCLMVFSWACQLHRIGTLVLVIHDFADIPLEGAKMAKYVKRQRLADLIFVVFAIAWIWSRCGLYPYRVIYYSSYVALFLVPMFPAYYIFNGLLCTLQLLHIMWTILILNIAIHALKNDGIKDLRSDDEESSKESSEQSDTIEKLPGNGSLAQNEQTSSNAGGDTKSPNNGLSSAQIYANGGQNHAKMS